MLDGYVRGEYEDIKLYKVIELTADLMWGQSAAVSSVIKDFGEGGAYEKEKQSGKL